MVSWKRTALHIVHTLLQIPVEGMPAPGNQGKDDAN